MAPAPAAAAAICTDDNSPDGADPERVLQSLWSCPYARKSVAFSAMAPTTGAGSPCTDTQTKTTDVSSTALSLEIRNVENGIGLTL